MLHFIPATLLPEIAFGLLSIVSIAVCSGPKRNRHSGQIITYKRTAMRRKILSGLFLSLVITVASAQGVYAASARVVERIHIATDRDAYIAGEPVWISLYCFDISKGAGKLSSFSSLAYIEL